MTLQLRTRYLDCGRRTETRAMCWADGRCREFDSRDKSNGITPIPPDPCPCGATRDDSLRWAVESDRAGTRRRKLNPMQLGLLA